MQQCISACQVRSFRPTSKPRANALPALTNASTTTTVTSALMTRDTMSPSGGWKRTEVPLDTVEDLYRQLEEKLGP